MKSYSEFNDLNEGLFDIFKNFFGKINKYMNKYKGAREVETIYQKYIKLINDEFIKQGVANISLGDTTLMKEHLVLSYNQFINEADTVTLTPEEQATVQKNLTPEQKQDLQKNNNIIVSNLKQKINVINNIIKKYEEMAYKEMSNVLKTCGGETKNPELAIIIDNKKDQFRLDFLNSEIAFLEKSGDKSLINQAKMDRDNLSKDLSNRWKNLDKVGNISQDGPLEIGKYYRYKTPTGIKTIKIINQSSEQGKVNATYLVQSDGMVKEQTFSIDNIDITYDEKNQKGFQPQPGKTYTYYSETDEKIIKVAVIQFDPKTGLLKLKSVKGNEFNGYIGAVRDEVVNKTA